MNENSILSKVSIPLKTKEFGCPEDLWYGIELADLNENLTMSEVIGLIYTKYADYSDALGLDLDVRNSAYESNSQSTEGYIGRRGRKPKGSVAREESVQQKHKSINSQSKIELNKYSDLSAKLSSDVSGLQVSVLQKVYPPSSKLLKNSTYRIEEVHGYQTYQVFPVMKGSDKLSELLSDTNKSGSYLLLWNGLTLPSLPIIYSNPTSPNVIKSQASTRRLKETKSVSSTDTKVEHVIGIDSAVEASSSPIIVLDICVLKQSNDRLVIAEQINVAVPVFSNSTESQLEDQTKCGESSSKWSSTNSTAVISDVIMISPNSPLIPSYFEYMSNSATAKPTGDKRLDSQTISIPLCQLVSQLQLLFYCSVTICEVCKVVCERVLIPLDQAVIHLIIPSRSTGTDKHNINNLDYDKNGVEILLWHKVLNTHKIKLKKLNFDSAPSAAINENAGLRLQ